jgi:starvation-inducible DNA-binding protein
MAIQLQLGILSLGRAGVGSRRSSASRLVPTGLIIEDTSMKNKSNQMVADYEERDQEAKPVLQQHGDEIQGASAIIPLPIGLDREVCSRSVQMLNRILADTMTLRDLYKKHHWQVTGATFYQLHLLFDKHYEEQAKLVDEIAERVQLLGGISVAVAADVAAHTEVPRAPSGREEVPVQLSRLLEAHGILLKEVRKSVRKAEEDEDDGTVDLLVSSVIRTNELQVWFLSQHLVDTPVVRAKRNT